MTREITTPSVTIRAATSGDPDAIADVHMSASTDDENVLVAKLVRTRAEYLPV